MTAGHAYFTVTRTVRWLLITPSILLKHLPSQDPNEAKQARTMATREKQISKQISPRGRDVYGT